MGQPGTELWLSMSVLAFTLWIQQFARYVNSNGAYPTIALCLTTVVALACGWRRVSCKNGRICPLNVQYV
eukprot:scaffold427_cov103-Alexandrium_tamarense.AAC.35